MTRHEYTKLCAAFGELSLAVSRLGDIVIAASREMIAEDKVNTSLEQIAKGTGNDHKQRPV